MGSHAGIAEALGIAQPDEAKPRLTLEPARCAVGISRSGAGFRVIHTLSGKELGVVARVGDGWCFASPSAECLTDAMFHYSSADTAATALSAHVLGHKLSAIRDRLALGVEAAKAEATRQIETMELGQAVVTALHDESDGIGVPAGMPHRLRARFLCVQQRGREAEAIRDRDVLAAGGEVV